MDSALVIIPQGTSFSAANVALFSDVPGYWKAAVATRAPTLDAMTLTPCTRRLAVGFAKRAWRAASSSYEAHSQTRPPTSSRLDTDADKPRRREVCNRFRGATDRVWGLDADAG